MDAVTFQAQAMQLERLMYHVSRSMLRSDADCADAVQEALVRAWQKRGTLRSMDKFKPWMLRILVNTCKDMLRRQSRQRFVSLEEETAAVEPPEAPAALGRAIDSLKPEWRVVVILHYLEGYSIADIAQVLRIPSGTVKSRLKNARDRLSVLIKEEWKEDV